MQSLHSPSSLSVMFDDDHSVANADLAFAGLLSEKLGLEDLCDELISIGPFRGDGPRPWRTHWSLEAPSSTMPTCCARDQRHQCSLTE